MKSKHLPYEYQWKLLHTEECVLAFFLGKHLYPQHTTEAEDKCSLHD